MILRGLLVSTCCDAIGDYNVYFVILRGLLVFVCCDAIGVYNVYCDTTGIGSVYLL